MRLNRLRVANFRNVEFADLELSGSRIFLFGENAQGKTNLLEAVSLLTALRSFRTRDLRQLVRYGEKLAQVALELDHETEGASSVLLSLSSTGTKRVEIGVDTPVKKMSDFVGRFPAVVFSSEDVLILRGAPTLRRRWFDVTFSAVNREYLTQLQRFYRALEARNKLLKNERLLDGQCEAFEKILAESGEFLVRSRASELAALADRFSEFARRILGTEVIPELIYAPSFRAESPGAWEDFFARSRRTDLIFHATQKGPHRDDFLFRLNGKSAADFASEGQQRSLSLALGLAQLALFRERTHIAPVVLADDVLSELDPSRRENFWREVGDDLQVIATGTQLPPQPEMWEIFNVKHGTYSK